MRGTLYWSLRFAASPGIIPACAGNTSIFKKENLYWGDHPRVCGGTLHHAERDRIIIGIIPACAGNTMDAGSVLPDAGDHPRVCGEHSFHRNCPNYVGGSSPRVRGTLFLTAFVMLVVGIIPACAGNTIKQDLNAVFEPGSSPRVRGTRNRQDWRHRIPGIIPACAGNTSRSASRCTQHRDHPRVCGEHSKEAEYVYPYAGSSPRVRGTRVLPHGRYERPGIIPACAGNTNQSERHSLQHRDHPRVCGEHCGRILKGSNARGSSPRVRGTLTTTPTNRRGRGIIPACAGNTFFVR